MTDNAIETPIHTDHFSSIGGGSSAFSRTMPIGYSIVFSDFGAKNNNLIQIYSSNTIAINRITLPTPMTCPYESQDNASSWSPYVELAVRLIAPFRPAKFITMAINIIPILQRIVCIIASRFNRFVKTRFVNTGMSQYETAKNVITTAAPTVIWKWPVTHQVLCTIWFNW